MEPVDLWKKGVPEKYAGCADVPAAQAGRRLQQHEGGHDRTRASRDGSRRLSAEVLYPTLMLKLFRARGRRAPGSLLPRLQRLAIEYCSVNRERLVGRRGDLCVRHRHAVKELGALRRRAEGALVWQAPAPDLPFNSKHYDRLWAAVQDLEAPVSMHILTGHSYHSKERKGIEALPRQRQPETDGCRERALRVHFLRRAGALPEVEARDRGK